MDTPLKRFFPLPYCLLAFALTLLPGCFTPSQELRIMYAESLRERLDDGQFSTLGDTYARNQAERIEKVRKLVKEEKLTTAADYLYAGVLLSSSGVEDDLIAASASGLKAAELGEDRGLRVAAEALDRRLMHRGKAQRYGTQYQYLEVIQKWKLYPVDPTTTDADRAMMGIPPLVELKAREAELNEEVR